jgi:hypothetical protein
VARDGLAGGAASCAGGPKGLIRRASSVFVGIVAEQSTSTARMDVEQVWRGRDLAPTIVVQTGQTQLPWPLGVFIRSGGSGDVALEPGTTYVVALEEDPQQLRTNSCLVAEATKPLLALAPDDARAPAADGLSGMRQGAISSVVAVVGGALIAALVFVVVVRRRRRG